MALPLRWRPFALGLSTTGFLVFFLAITTTTSQCRQGRGTTRPSLTPKGCRRYVRLGFSSLGESSPWRRTPKDRPSPFAGEGLLTKCN